MDHLLADKRKKYHVRGINRSVSSPKAQKLASRGVEVVEGDLEHKDTLVKVPACLPAATRTCAEARVAVIAGSYGRVIRPS